MPKVSPHYNAGNGVTYTVQYHEEPGPLANLPGWQVWEHDDKAPTKTLIGFYPSKKGAQAAIRRLIPKAKD